MVLNVYTTPLYRHKGYARMLMKRLMSDAVEKNLSFVELQSTEEGYPLYKSVGFVNHESKYHSMRWYNQRNEITMRIEGNERNINAR